MCLKENSRSPSTWLRGSWRIRSRASSASSARSIASASLMLWSTPRQNVLPITDASSRTERSSDGRMSIRDAIASRTVVGSSAPPRAASPRRSRVEELRPREREEGDRDVSDMRAEVFEELDLARLRPVQVLEHENRRTLRTEAFDQSANGEEQRKPVVGRLVEAEPEH